MRLVNIVPPHPLPLSWFSFDLQSPSSSPGMMELAGFTRRWYFLFTLTRQGVMAVHVCFYAHTWESVCGCVPVWVCMCSVGACAKMCVLPSTWTVFKSLFLFLCYHGYWSGGAGKPTVCNGPPPPPLSAWFGLIHRPGWWGGTGGEKIWTSWHGGDW